MQVRGVFPAGAVGGGAFVTGRYEVGPGERVVDLDTDLDALPAFGLLCVHESTVRMMMTALGWEYDEHEAAKLRAADAEIRRLRKINQKMRDALVAVVEAATDAGIELRTLDGVAR